MAFGNIAAILTGVVIDSPDYDPNYQTFCFYCQHDYTSFDSLKRHLQEIHPGTYAQLNLAPVSHPDA